MAVQQQQQFLLVVVVVVHMVALAAGGRQQFREAPQFYNSPECPPPTGRGNGGNSGDEEEEHSTSSTVCSDDIVHVAMTLDGTYLRGSMAAILSILQHSSCPENIDFHFITSDDASSASLRRAISSSFPYLRFSLYPFRSSALSATPLDRPSPAVLAAPEYCNANFTSYFTPTFWSNPSLSLTFAGRRPCYFNTGVMVIDLHRWRAGDYTAKIEEWMELQKRMRIYELGSLPPFLLVFAGNIAPVDHRWNQHGLGGDNFRGLCRDLHPGPVSLLHWSGKGKPWARLDANRPCPLDALWAPYDLLHPPFPLDS
ncbi:hypothetical protein Sjap_010451 [Stephania japonica]|uniref:Hexosyltransferase n=1 Tax=Stephania japonica TaxID=461633 RepID=A0AAP0J9L6_9MAGN